MLSCMLLCDRQYVRDDDDDSNSWVLLVTIWTINFEKDLIEIAQR